MLENQRGKTGMPKTAEVTVAPVASKVKHVIWMNRDREIPFRQEADRVTMSLDGVEADPVDTIFKLELADALPASAIAPRLLHRRSKEAVPPGNLATHKPARLLNPLGTEGLVPSGMNLARYGVDGDKLTVAQGAHSWAWTFQVDLEKVLPIRRVVIHFGKSYATEYSLMLSADGKRWTTAATVRGCEGGRREHTFDGIDARYVRIRAIKPNGPGQKGNQMQIAELEVYP